MECSDHIISMTRECCALQAVVRAGKDDLLSAGTQPPTARVGCEGRSSPREDQHSTTCTASDASTMGDAERQAEVVDDRGAWASAEAGLAGYDRGADLRRTYRDRLEYDRQIARAAKCPLCTPAAAQAPQPSSFVRGQTSEPLTIPFSGLLSAGENGTAQLLFVLFVHLLRKPFCK